MNSHKLDTKKTLLQKRRWRVRAKVSGTASRPRLSLRLTNKHIHAQVIDDVAGKTLAAVSSVKSKVHPNLAGCAQLGESFGSELKKAKIEEVVFDRNGRRYHGTVKAFADAVRKAGVKF
jgi:large subunit ribosomal protein L18